MKKRAWLALIALVFLSTGASATNQSTINPLVPVQNSPLTSAPVRNNFQAAYNDINNIYTLIPGGVTSINNATGGFTFTGTGVSCSSTVCTFNGGGGGMVYPGAGWAVSTGSAWATSITPGTGVATAVAVNVGSAGSVVVNGGALGTPSSGVATNLTGTASALNIGGNAATVTNGVYTTDTGTVTNTMLAGSIANGKLSNSSITIAGHSVSLGGTQTIACADLSNGATGCSTATGTSGATLPLLNGANTWSGVQSITNGDLALKGSSSGAMTIEAPAVASTYVMTFPAATDTVAALGVSQTFSGTDTFSSGVTMTGLSSGTVASNSYIGLNSSNQLVLGSGGGGGGTITLGTSAAATNPQRTSEATTGLYSLNSGEIDLGVVTTGLIEKLTSVGEYLTGALTITSNSANSLAVGPNGATTPVLQVDSSTASQVGGIKVTGANSSGIASIYSNANLGLALGVNSNSDTEIGGSSTVFNSSTSSASYTFKANGSNIFLLGNGANIAAVFTPGGYSNGYAQPKFWFIDSGDSSWPASEEPIEYFNNASGTRSHATGSITLQRDFLINGKTDASAATSTMTDGATEGIILKSAGSNLTVTNESGLLIQSTALSGTVTNSFGVNVAAATGATNNYAAQFVGNILLPGSSSGSVLLEVPAAAGTGTVFDLPSSNGTNGYVLSTDGSGNTSWVAQSGGGGTVTLGTSAAATNPQRSGQADTGVYSAASGHVSISVDVAATPTLIADFLSTGETVTGVLTATSFTGAGTGLTGTASSLTAGTVTTNANLTGPITSSGNATSVAGAAAGEVYAGATPSFTATPTLGVNGATTGTLALANSAGSGASTTIQPSSGTTSAWTLTLPTSGGTSGYVLSTNGSGLTSWVVNGSGSMVYPGAGIGVSTGSAWATSLSSTAPAFTTSVTSPIIYGGSSTGSTLTLDGTSNGSPASAYVLLNPAGQGNVGIGTTTPVASLDDSHNTDAIALPAGTTAQRPSSPVNGEIRYNSDNNGAKEGYINGGWATFVNYGGNNKNINVQNAPYSASGFLVQTTTNPTAATGTATQSTTTLTVVTSAAGTLGVGAIVTINGQTPEVITALGTGTGGTGTYTVSVSETVGSATAFTSPGGTASGVTTIPVVNGSAFNTGQIAVIYQGGSSQSPGHKNFACNVSSTTSSTIVCSGTAVSGNGLPTYAPSSSGTSLTTYIPGNYLVYSVGTTTLSGSASSGATTLALTNAAGYYAGQGLFVYGGATSGANLITTITAVSGNSVTISPGISNASGVASGVYVQHDDTAAFQAAVNVANYNNSVDISVPDGFYQINGVASGTGLNQINLPSLNYYVGCCNTWAATQWGPQPTVNIHGFTAAPQSQGYLAGINMAPMQGAIIQSSNSTAGASIIGAYNSSSLADMTNVQFIVKNLTMRQQPNPPITNLNGTYVQEMSVYNFSCDTGETSQTTQPMSNSNNSCIQGPAGDNGGNNVFSQLEVYGYYWGIQISEHSRMEHIRFDNDYYAILVSSQNGAVGSNYGVTAVDLQFNGDVHGIATYCGSPINVDMSLLNYEHQSTPAWAANSDDISDSSNCLYGFMSVDSPLDSNTQTVVGAANVHIANARSAAYPLASATFANLTSGAPNGTTEYCTNCTATSSCASGGNGALATMINSVWSCTNGYQYSVGSTTSSGTPSVPVGTSGNNLYKITALAANITTLTFTGTPYDGEVVELVITDNGTSRTLTWGAGSTIVVAATVNGLPTATTVSTPLRIWFQYNSSNTTWYIVGYA